MTKARFQSALLLNAEDTAFLAFAQAKGLGKSRADVIRKLVAARRVQYQAGFNAWLVSPEGRNTLRVEGLEGLVGPNLDVIHPTEVVEADMVENNTGISPDSMV